MIKHLLTALASAFTAFGKALSDAADSAGDTSPETPQGDPAEPARRRGRPPGTAAKAADAAEDPGIPLAKLQEAIKPLIDEGRGLEVKEVVKKHGGSKLSEIPAANQAAFLKDIEAISY